MICWSWAWEADVPVRFWMWEYALGVSCGGQDGWGKRFYPFDYDVEGDEDCADGIEPPYMCDLSMVI